MTLLFTDGFDDGMSRTKWPFISQGVSITDTDGRRGGRSLWFSGSNADAVVGFDPRNEIIVGFAFKHHAGSGGSYYTRIGFQSGATSQFSLHAFSADGHLRLARGSSAGGLIADTGYFPPDREWIYVEIRAVLSPTVGQIELRVDGATIVNLSDINTGSAAEFDNISFHRSLFAGFHIDDIYICDTLGDDNNDFLGDVEIRPILPVAAGSRTQMVNSDGTSVDNFAYVNDPGNEATFVQGGENVGDLYAMGDVDPDDIILGVVQYHTSKMSDSGVQKARHLTRQDGVDYDGPDELLGFANKAYPRIFELAPDGTPWTPAKLNAIEMGVEGRA